jgi:hypothetical protein
MPRNYPLQSIEFPDSEPGRSGTGSGLANPILLFATLGLGLTLLSDSSDGSGVTAAFGNLAAAAGHMVGFIMSSFWNAAFTLARDIIAVINDSLMNSSGGLGELFPNSGGLVASVLAMTLCGLVLLGISGPLYAAWKTWRIDRAHHLNHR